MEVRERRGHDGSEVGRASCARFHARRARRTFGRSSGALARARIGARVLLGLIFFVFGLNFFALLAPIVVNIILFHGFLAPAGIILPLVTLALEIFLAWSYRSVYRPMLAAKAIPDAG